MPGDATSPNSLKARKDLAKEHDALKQPEQAAKFRAEMAALNSKVIETMKSKAWFMIWWSNQAGAAP